MPAAESHSVNDAIVISNLIEHPHWVATVSAWHHGEWLQAQSARPGASVKPSEIAKKKGERERLLASHLSDAPIPATFVAHCAGMPVGSVSLVYYQFTQDQRPSEWLTNLFVLPNNRYQGIGDGLLRHALRYAQHHDVARLMLYTNDRAAFYRKRQWRPVNRGIVQGQKVDILDYLLE